MIHNGGVEDVGGLFGAGTSTDTTIDKGGIENVRSGGKAIGTIISGGTENVAAGGTSKGTIIKEGTENVAAGGTATGTTIRNGGVEIVAGKSTGTTIEAGGIENVLSGGTSTGTNISGGTENVQGGGTAIKTIIDHGTENVQSGGTATDVIFAGAHSTLELATPSGLNGTINNWHDLGNFAFSSDATVSFSSGTLTVTNGNQHAALSLSGLYSTSNFALASHGAHGTLSSSPLSLKLCFGSSKRNQSFMTASQSVYMLQVNTQGAAPG